MVVAVYTPTGFLPGTPIVPPGLGPAVYEASLMAARRVPVVLAGYALYKLYKMYENQLFMPTGKKSFPGYTMTCSTNIVFTSCNTPPAYGYFIRPGGIGCYPNYTGPCEYIGHSWGTPYGDVLPAPGQPFNMVWGWQGAAGDLIGKADSRYIAQYPSAVADRSTMRPITMPVAIPMPGRPSKPKVHGLANPNVMRMTTSPNRPANPPFPDAVDQPAPIVNYDYTAIVDLSPPVAGEKPVPGVRPVDPVVTAPGAGAGTPTQVLSHARAVPERHVKERKFRSPAARFGINFLKLLDSVSEKAEVVDAIYKALPKEVRKRWEKQYKDRGVIDQWGQYGLDGADWKARAIWHNWDKVDITKAIANVAINEIEDMAIGQQQAIKEKMFGPLLPKPLNYFNGSARGFR